jgi:glycosyltransferase involved in cell wall biosynthesis
MTKMRKSGKLIVVSEHYAPDPSTTATYMTAIAKGLCAERDVLVISGTAHSASAAQSKPHQPYVVEVSNSTPRKDALIRRATANVLFSVKIFFALLKHLAKNDVVLCVTTPFTLPYSVILATKLRGASAILVIYDLYPEALVMAGLSSPKSRLTRALRLANGHLFRALDAIITIGRDVEPLLLSYRGVESRKIRFIPNWALLPIAYREIAAANTFRRRFKDQFVVGLGGNLGFTHSVSAVFDAARLLKDEHNIHMVLSGWGIGWKQLTELYAAAPLGNITLMDPVAEAELETFLSAADVWIIPYRRNIAGVSVPSRIYNLLAVGRPIIVAAEPFSEAALMLNEEDIGWVVRPEDPLHLAETIRLAATNREQTLAKGRRAARAAERYTYENAIASYRKIVNDVMISRSVKT